jgi:hypothetical protein
MSKLADYKAAAELIYPGFGAWTYDTFDRLNHEHFEGRVPLMPIRWHHTLAYGAKIGLAVAGGTPAARIDIAMHFRGQWAFDETGAPNLAAEHLLLHEMIHHFLSCTGRETKHHSRDWCDEIERIGIALGIKPFRASPSKVTKVRIDDHRVSKRVQVGDLAMTEIATFPHFAFDYTSGKIKPEWIASEKPATVAMPAIKKPPIQGMRTSQCAP